MPWATSRGRCGVAETVTSRLGGVALPLYLGLCGECGPVRKRVAYPSRGVGWTPGTSAVKPGREHCRGHVAAGEDPAPARPGPGL